MCDAHKNSGPLIAPSWPASWHFFLPHSTDTSVGLCTMVGMWHCFCWHYGVWNCLSPLYMSLLFQTLEQSHILNFYSSHQHDWLQEWYAVWVYCPEDAQYISLGKSLTFLSWTWLAGGHLTMVLKMRETREVAPSKNSVWVRGKPQGFLWLLQTGDIISGMREEIDCNCNASPTKSFAAFPPSKYPSFPKTKRTQNNKKLPKWQFLKHTFIQYASLLHSSWPSKQLRIMTVIWPPVDRMDVGSNKCYPR